MRNFALIGHPVAHSLSPQIFKIIFDEYQINASYSLINITSTSDLLNFVQNEIDSLSGFNITLPYKKIICSYLNDLDDISSLIKSVNCVKVIGSKLIGYNTDHFGFEELLDNHNINYIGKNILILGNGGAARTIAYTMLSKYQNNIFIWGRNSNKTDSLIKSISPNRLSKYAEPLNKQWIIINCLSVDIDKNNINDIIDSIPLEHSDIFIDINYIRTPLSNEIKKNKCKVIMGQDMLIFQALKSFNIWFDNQFDTNICYKKIKNKIFKL